MFRYPFLFKALKPFVRYCGCECTPAALPSNTKLTILPNGVRIATEETNASLAAISMFVEAGSRYEKECNNGITHFIEHLAYKGFKSMPKAQLDEILINIGAKLNIQTGRELQFFSAQCLAEHAPIVIDIFARIILEPAFNQHDIEAEKSNLYQELLQSDNNPKQVAFDYLHQTAFQGTPLAQRVIGPTNNLETFDSTYCHTYHRAHYQPYKLSFVSSGLLDHDNLVSAVNAKLGCMEYDADAQSDEGPCRFTGSEVRFRDDSMPFCHVAIAVEVPGYNSADYYALLAASYIIGSYHKNQGGGLNHASPLVQAAAAGLCEYLEPFFITYRDVGLWGVYYVSNKMKADDMMLNVQDAFMYLCQMVQHTDVKRGANLAKLDLARSVEGSLRSCYDLAKQIMYRCGRKSLEECCASLDSLNHQNIKEVCGKYLYDRCPAVAAVGSTENLIDYTRIRAGMYWLRL